MSDEPVYCNAAFNSLATDSKTTGQETWSTAQTLEKTEHRCQPQQSAIVFLSLTCAFLLAGIIALLVCYYLTAGQLRKENSAFKEANQQLQDLKSNLTAQKESLESENTQLRKNQTLMGQLKKENSAFKEANQQLQDLKSNLTAQKESLESENTQLRKDRTLMARRCSRCPSGWTFNNSKCYFVFLGQTWKTWKSWEDSRLECLKMGADLLTIQNKEEQMFIMNFAPTYYDKWHGYWIGLTGKSQDWVWINGSSLTTGFWADAGSQNKTHVLTNTGHKDKALNSWRSTNPDMLNRWICENKALLF